MPHRSLYRVCGPALVAAGLLLLGGFALRPAQPATLISAAEMGLDKWVLANWLFAMGAVVLLGGWLGLTEHLNHAVVEGWSTLGLGAVIIGSVGLAVAGVIGAESLPSLLEMYADQRASVAVQSYTTLYIITVPLGMMSWMILWVGTALTGLAIAEDDEYPRLLGYTGLVISMLEIATQLMPEGTLVRDAFGIIGCIWIVAVGVIFTRIDTTGAERATLHARPASLV